MTTPGPSFPGSAPSSIPTPVSTVPEDAVPGLRRLLVAGTAGGVGTTTVAALLFAALRDAGDAPFLIDHTGGELGPRIPGGDEVAAVDHRFRLHDLGRNIAVAADALADPGTSLIMVTAATALGRTLAAEQLRTIGQRHAGSEDAGDHQPRHDPVGKVVLVQVECFGRRGRESIRGLTVGEQVLLPLDDVLAAGGRIPANRLARPTRQAIRRLAGAVRPDLVR